MFKNRIEINSEVLRGKPVIKGTRISVEQVLKKVGAGIGWDKIAEELDITEDDIRAALKYAEQVISNEEVYLETV